jgi:uncharacterized protein YciI
MKSLFISVILLTLTLSVTGQVPNKDYDPELAGKLGGNDNGMKNYFFVMLRTGPNNVTDKAIRDSLFRGHMANINKMADMGKLIVAGPFGKNDKEYRGIFIMDVASIDEAKELLQGDPTIREKVFEADIVPWFGSAALPEYLKAHKKIIKTMN